MSENGNGERRPWFRIGEPIHEYGLTGGQEDAIRLYAHNRGFETLRGFHMWMRSMGWDYYNILRIMSPEE